MNDDLFDLALKPIQDVLDQTGKKPVRAVPPRPARPTWRCNTVWGQGGSGEPSSQDESIPTPDGRCREDALKRVHARDGRAASRPGQSTRWRLSRVAWTDGTHLLPAPSRALQEDVHAVVIVGGGARIPKIQEKIKILMKRDTLNRNLNGALPWLFPQALRHADQIRSDS